MTTVVLCRHSQHLLYLMVLDLQNTMEDPHDVHQGLALRTLSWEKKLGQLTALLKNK